MDGKVAPGICSLCDCVGPTDVPVCVRTCRATHSKGLQTAVVGDTPVHPPSTASGRREEGPAHSPHSP